MSIVLLGQITKSEQALTHGIERHTISLLALRCDGLAQDRTYSSKRYALGNAEAFNAKVRHVKAITIPSQVKENHVGNSDS